MNTIKYHLVQKAQPGVEGGGERKYYATVTERQNITLNSLSEEIADGRTLTPTDVMAVLISLSKKIPKHIARGHIVELGDLGHFSLNISSKGSLTEEEFSEENFRDPRIHFRPAVEFVNAIGKIHYAKAKAAQNGQ